jgi:hypothetical protein
MRLYTTDNSELMEITKITAEGGNLIVVGTIMGAVPVKAVLKPEDMRGAFKTMSVSTMARAALMLVQRTAVPWAIGAGLLALFALYLLYR